MSQTKTLKPIPDGYHSLTPCIMVRGAKRALAFYEKAFGAETVTLMEMPGSDKVMHAEMRIGDCRVMMGDEWPEMPGSPVSPESVGNAVTSSLFLYTEDTDAAYKRAISAGCKPLMPPENQFWGDRYAKVVDPFGHQWQFATHVEDVSPEEMHKRAMAAFATPKK